jgi:hypothetical protein
MNEPAFALKKSSVKYFYKKDEQGGSQRKDRLLIGDD